MAGQFTVAFCKSIKSYLLDSCMIWSVFVEVNTTNIIFGIGKDQNV